MRGSDPRVAEKARNARRRLRALREPVLNTLLLQSHLLHVVHLARQRVVRPHLLDELAVPRAARVHDPNAVEGAVLPPEARQPNTHTHCLHTRGAEKNEGGGAAAGSRREQAEQSSASCWDAYNYK